MTFDNELFQWQHDDKTGVDLIGRDPQLNVVTMRYRWEEIQADMKRRESEERA